MNSHHYVDIGVMIEVGWLDDGWDEGRASTICRKLFENFKGCANNGVDEWVQMSSSPFSDFFNIDCYKID